MSSAKPLAADSPPATAAAQQSDNVAHALAGAGGGILSTALTYGSLTQPLVVPFLTPMQAIP
jgi:hypothetical protein